MNRLELEQAAVGGALVSPTLARGLTIIGAAAFRDPCCRAVATSIERLYTISRPVDSITVRADLKARGRHTEARSVIYFAATVPTIHEAGIALERLADQDDPA